MTILRQYPLTICCIAGILVLSFMPIPEMELADLPFHIGWDKLVHFIEFSVLPIVLVVELWRNKVQPKHAVLSIILIPFLLGALVELGQEYLTSYRTGRWDDLCADLLGTTLAVIAILAVHKIWNKAFSSKE